MKTLLIQLIIILKILLKTTINNTNVSYIYDG